MKRGIERIIRCMLAGILLLCSCALAGCTEDYLPEYESGYFRYALRTEGREQKAYLIGLTELGKQQEILIYPEEIDGIPVYGIGYYVSRPFWMEVVGEFESYNLKKFYFPQTPKETTDFGLSVRFHGRVYEIYWNCQERYRGLPGVDGMICGYAFYNKYIKSRYMGNSSNYIANVNYMYNYAGAENEGCYWADGYNEEIITFIPPEPEREGYTFGGWYKEAECIEPWDFAADKTGKSINIRIGQVYETYEGIYLYAKWVKN